MENFIFCVVYWFVEHETLINPFHATGHFPYPLKTRGFLMFSEGIERDQCYEFFFQILIVICGAIAFLSCHFIVKFNRSTKVISLQCTTLTWNFMKKETLTQVFFCELCEFLKTPFLQKTSRRLRICYSTFESFTCLLQSSGSADNLTRRNLASVYLLKM